MMSVTRSGIFHTTYHLSRDGATLVDLDMRALRKGAPALIDGESYFLHRGVWECRLSRHSTTVGTAKPRSWLMLFCPTWRIQYLDRAFELECTGAAGAGKRLREGGCDVGHISGRGWFGSECTVRFADIVPIPLQVFVFWYTATLWENSD